MTSAPATPARRAQLVTLGCARNDTDSEELAARLEAGGWSVTAEDSAETPDVVLVNTCGFIASAKKDSVDALLAAADSGARVVAVGCLAERYGEELAAELPEAAAVLGFDRYPTLAADLDRVVAGESLASHTPTDRRSLLPVVPLDRPGAPSVSTPGHGGEPPQGHGGEPPQGHGGEPPQRHGGGPPQGHGTAPLDEELSVPVPGGSRILRRRLDDAVVASLKIASGCDRRCSFCAIPSFRGSFISRLPDDIVAEAQWLAGTGVRELVLVSENSTSYGKDLGDLRALETLLPRLAAIPGIVRVRPVYLQPAEVRPGLVEVMTSTPGIAAYADLSFQHSSPEVLRRMRRFGGTDRFLELLDAFRARSPQIGARSNVIVGFPGETEDDVVELERFLTVARLDVVGVFGYSDEDGTEAATLEGALPQDVIDARVDRLRALVEELTSQRAEERLGETVQVLVESIEGGLAEGRADHQQPEVDGGCVVRLEPGAETRVGDLIAAIVVATEGVDLICEAVGEHTGGLATADLAVAHAG